MQKQKVAKTLTRIFDLFFLLDSCFARIAIEVMAVVLCVILARNERNRTWASIERNFVAEITRMITPKTNCPKLPLTTHFALQSLSLSPPPHHHYSQSHLALALPFYSPNTKYQNYPCGSPYPARYLAKMGLSS